MEQYFLNLGLPGVMLGIFILVTKFFIKTIERKDDYLKEIINRCSQRVEQVTTQYSETVNDHMRRHSAIMEKQNDNLNHLIKVVTKLEEKIE